MNDCRISLCSQRFFMPAKVRKIKGNVEFTQVVEQIDPFSGEPTGSSLPNSPQKYGGLIDFNKSLDYKGGTLGKITIETSETGTDFIVKVKQDLDDNGKFSKNELIYKGTIENAEDADTLINFEGKIKIKRQMNACNWDLQKLSSKDVGIPVSCSTLDSVVEFTELTLKPVGGLAIKLPIYFSNLDQIVEVEANNLPILGS